MPQLLNMLKLIKSGAECFEADHEPDGLERFAKWGLSQVYGFIAQSGGDIKIESVLGIGTEVSLFIPIYQNDDKQDKVKTHQEVVLIVDDEPDVLELAVELFEHLGYHALSAKSGEEAWEIVNRHPSLTLLFSDVMMPGTINGIELAKRTAKANPKTKIILASGFPMSAAADKNSMESKFAFMSKPYRLQDIAVKIRELT